MKTMKQLVDAAINDPDHIFNRPPLTWQEEDALNDAAYAEEQLYFQQQQDLDEC